ncbi:WD40-repeat-containing domain protein [Schizothecium vesticola]|uniref:WD40-repeat-containing domain protein n=1 Tax=Schizothecium vesticola TaxID=314040 RepID=A0AA40FA23_9PEZI|nr:WD40-repeat-containing domain protein [Schizothecium vesticola]
MYNLSCVDWYEYPEAEQQTYVFDLLPTVAGLATTSSDQRLCLFDPLRLNDGPLKSIQTNHENLICAKVYNPAESIVATTGQNGTISVWDLRLDPSNAEALHIGDGASLPALLSLACCPQTNTLAVGTELANHQASIIIWDVRSPAVPQLQYNEVHSDDISELNYHPATPNLLLSGSTDGIVNLCDILLPDEDDVIVTAFNHGSIHRAGFLPASATPQSHPIYALSHDEKLALYDGADGAASTIWEIGDVRSVLSCRYAAGVVPKAEGGAVVGVGTQEDEMFLWGRERWGWGRDTVVGLPGAHSGELVRSFCFLDEERVVFTAGEDGCVMAWKAET